MNPIRYIICLILLTFPVCLLLRSGRQVMANPHPEIDALQAIRDAGELAFERKDINTIETLWVRDGDALMTTPLGTRHQGFAEIKRALLNLFALLGQTTIDTRDLFFTLNGDHASITMKYTWNVVPGTLFDLTERYRKVDGEWKIYISDSQDHTLPLHPDDEKAMVQLAKQVQGGLLDKDIPAIAGRVADDFTYVATDGTTYQGWPSSANALAADVELIAAPQLESISLRENQACGRYTMKLSPEPAKDGKTRKIQFTFVGPNWKLALIHFNPEAESFAVEPSGKRSTTWGQVKEEK